MKSMKGHAEASVELGAITRNVAALRAHVAPAAVMAVVKANGYGHGAVPAAQAAVRGGADWLGVVHVAEALEVRRAGVDVPLLCLMAIGTDDHAAAIAANVDLAAGSGGSVELQATGGLVAWSARTWGALRLSRSSGRLGAGQTVTVSVYVSRRSRARGEGGISFQPGGIQVCVTWRADTPGTPGGGSTPTPPPTGPGTGAPSTPTETNRPGDPPTSSEPDPPSSAPPRSDPPPPSDPAPSGGEPDPPSSDPPASSSASGPPSPSNGSATPA